MTAGLSPGWAAAGIWPLCEYPVVRGGGKGERPSSTTPGANYVVLAASEDTVFVFAAAIAAADIGDELARWPLDQVRATRGQDAWAIDITIDGRTLNFTGARMDTATLELIDLLTAPVN